MMRAMEGVMSSLKGINGQSVEHLRNRVAFDYSTLPSPTVEFLKAQVHRIRRQTAISIIGIGKDLIAAKHYLSHGLFLSWVEAEVGIPARTAQAYMRVAHWSGHKSATVALLPPSVLYLLSSPRTPQAFIADVLRRIELGERIALPAIRKELKHSREGRIDQKATGVDAVQWEQKNWSVMIEPATALRRAVTILARGLSANDFAEVRQILTSETVRQDRALGKNIAAAFAECNATDGIESGAYGYRRHGPSLCAETAPSIAKGGTDRGVLTRKSRFTARSA
jgi:hypothetical protein